MADLISREALLDKLEERYCVHCGVPLRGAPCGGCIIEAVSENIKHFPAVDAVPVVRCGECIHRVRGSWAKCTGRRPYEFCSDGERRFKDATD